MKSRLSALPAGLVFGLLALLSGVPFQPAHAAATSQTTHAWLCRPAPAVGANGPLHVVNTSVAGGGAYNLNNEGCGLIASADIGYFLSQGYYYGPNVFTAQSTAIVGGASGTASESTGITLPAYGWVIGVVLCETAGNAVTGGLNVGDAGSATRFASAVTLAANACVTIADSALTRIYAPSGVPTADAIVVNAASSWNNASVNVTLLYTYF